MHRTVAAILARIAKHSVALFILPLRQLLMHKPSTAIILETGDPADESTLLDVLDHLLNAGVVISGNVVISLAGVDLIYVRLDVILTSVESGLRHMEMSLLQSSEPTRRT